MRKKNNFVLGICPIGKVLFSHEDTIRQKNEIYRKMDELHVPYVTIDSIVTDGIVRKMDDINPAVSALKAQGADALFLPHCNFGTEGAVGLIAKEMGVPVLLWGPRDEAPLPSGVRQRDSLCGCFASSRVLQLMNIKFDYIVNCFVDDNEFTQGIDKFIRAAKICKAMRTVRIGQVGMRVPFFWCTINDEAELLNKFGPQVQPIDTVELIDRIKARALANERVYMAEIASLEWFDAGNIPTEGLVRSLALRDELFDLAEEYNIDAFAIQFFDSLQESIGEGAGLGLMMVEEAMPCSAETDVYGAISSVLIEAAEGGNTPSFFPEFTIRHPKNENAVLLWHASAAPSLRHPDVKKISIKEPWILEYSSATSPQFYLKEGEITVMRFDGLGGKFFIGTGEGRSIKGPFTREVYTWMETNDWSSWEKKLIKWPFIHHTSCVYGSVADSIELATELMGIECVRFDK